MQDETGISATEPDWSRESLGQFWEPGKQLLRCVRRYQAAKARGGLRGRVAAKYWAGLHRVWSVLTQSEVHLHMRIGGGLRLPHATGIILHPESVIGPNCMIFQQVTLAGAVTVGGHVDIGAGAKVLGPLSIGDHARIGANAVVTRDVAPGATVAGNPAREIGGAHAKGSGLSERAPETQS